MKLEVIGKPYAIGLMDLDVFKQMLSRVNLKSAIDSSIRIVENSHSKELNDEALKTLIWGDMDWGTFLDNVPECRSGIVKFEFYFVKYQGWQRLFPKVLTGSHVEFDKKTMNGMGTIIKQDLIKDRNFDLRNFINGQAFSIFNENGDKLSWEVG